MQTYAELKASVIKVLNELPQDKVAEVLEFVLLIRSRIEKERGIIKNGSSQTLKSLIGCLDLGGDAVADAENYWD
jgi:hypothetical protein